MKIEDIIKIIEKCKDVSFSYVCERLNTYHHSLKQNDEKTLIRIELIKKIM